MNQMSKDDDTETGRYNRGNDRDRRGDDHGQNDRSYSGQGFQNREWVDRRDPNPETFTQIWIASLDRKTGQKEI
jgi:hypothetical protein